MGTRNLPPKAWMLGASPDHLPAPQQQSGVEEGEVTLPTCIPVADDPPDAQLNLDAFKGELDSAVSQYISQVRDLGFKEEPAKDQKLLAVKFQLDPDEIKVKEEEETQEDETIIKEILKEDKEQQTQTEEEEEVTSLDNPLYLTLSECSSGLLDSLDDHPSLHHFYENGQVLREDEHIYENVENSAGEDDLSEDEEHLYDTLPRHKPDVPPKPDFLSQLAARQSEPVKRAWNPFVNLSVDTGDPTPPLSTVSSLSSPDSSQAEDSVSSPSTTNPFRPSAPRDTSEQTLLLEGSETSDLGSSGGEYDVVSVEDWPLPPTPPLAEEEVILEGEPLPPPPPEIALQQLEEEVLRQEEEDRKLALQKEKKAIEREYGNKISKQEAADRVEAVNTSLQQKLGKTSRSYEETQPEPKIIQIDADDGESFETPAIRHSVIIELKDSCSNVPKSIRPSEVRKESVKRSQSLKFSGVLRRSSSHKKVSRRESLCQVFPSLQDQIRKPEQPESPVPSEASDRNPIKFTFLGSRTTSFSDNVIEISDDELWEMKDTSMEDAAATSTPSPRSDIDPFTDSPIAVPPLSPQAITAPPMEFQNVDGLDGVYSASVISTHSGPSSLASTAPDSLGESFHSEGLAATPASETILEEPSSEDHKVGVPDSTSDLLSPQTKEAPSAGPQTLRNLGAAIMERHEMELQKKKNIMNLPEHSLLEFGDSVRDLEEQRRSVIKQMTVKAKRKDTWIKTFNMHDQGKEESIPVAPSRTRRKNSPCRPHTATQDAEASLIAAPSDKSEPTVADASLSPVVSDSPKAPTIEDFDVVPPKVSRKKKVPVQPQKQTSVAEEEHVISPKNTEILAALFSSPNKTSEDTNDQHLSLISQEKVTEEDVKLDPPEEIAAAPSGEPEPQHCPVPESNITVEPEVCLEKPLEPVVFSSLETTALTLNEEPSWVKEEVPADATPDGQDWMVKEKNELNLAHIAVAASEEPSARQEEEPSARQEEEQEEETVEEVSGKAADDAQPDEHLGDEGEVEYFSILDNKSATKSYWETRMLATMDDGGWESVANVRFQPISGVPPTQPQVEDGPLAVPPPPQFDNSPTESDASPPHSLEDTTPAPADPEPRPTKQYVYGVTSDPPKDTRGARIVDTVAKKPASQENIIEAEIRAQQLKEEEMRERQAFKNNEARDKGASSPASHESDEGFVDRLDVTGPPPHLPAAPSYTHALPGTDGETVIYDAVSPPPQEYMSDRSTPTPSNPPTTPTTTNATEARIALEIRELKEREDELRQMREELMASRENLLDDEEVRSSASREHLLEDHLTSLTTTTDEGNFSECGDPASSEDKSSDGSNSRMMSPDLHHPGSHLDFGRRRVTVKPYEEEDEEDQPVYTRMQKESVIEREIRLAREREEAYRREKGLITTTTSQRPAPAPAPATTPAPAPATAPARGPAPVPAPATAPAPAPATATAPQRLQLDGRDVQHRMATSRIQLEIQETSMKEKELRDAGKILTMSEDTVDSKVTRMSDFSDMSHLQQQQQQPLDSPRTHNSISPRPSSTTPASTPKRSPSPRSPASPVPNFTPSPALNRNGLSRSLSTNNLSTTSSTILPNPRAPKGLMQKFIASRGKMTGSAFASPPPTLTHTTSTSRGVPTRPMRVEPKAAVVQREALAKIKPELATANSTAIESYTQHQKQMYRRSYCTAEEKIQSELKEMQMREEELRRLRAFQMAQSQPNLLDVAGEEEHDFTEEEESNHSLSDMSSLRSALSNPNLLEEPEQTQVLDKGVRRRSALIAQWENRIQQTTDT